MNCMVEVPGRSKTRRRDQDVAWRSSCPSCSATAIEQTQVIEDRPGDAPIQILACRWCGRTRACCPGWLTRCHVCLDDDTDPEWFLNHDDEPWYDVEALHALPADVLGSLRELCGLDPDDPISRTRSSPATTQSRRRANLDSRGDTPVTVHAIAGTSGHPRTRGDRYSWLDGARRGPEPGPNRLGEGIVVTDFGEEFGSRVLTDEAVDGLLAELATGAGEFICDNTAAEKTVEGCSAESDRLLEQRVARSEWPNPREVIASLRVDLAAAAERELDRMTREFVAWWADVAGYVVLATATDTPIDRARVVVAAPCAGWAAGEGGEAVFGESEQVSELVGLAGAMAGAALDSDARQRELLAAVKDLAARNGLVMRRSAQGELIVSQERDDLNAETHRRWLWGVVWADHRLPELPDIEQLENALVACATPRPVVEDVRAAALAVAEVLAASVRLGELPTLAEQLREREPLELNLTDAEMEALHDLCDQATDRLVLQR